MYFIVTTIICTQHNVNDGIVYCFVLFYILHLAMFCIFYVPCFDIEINSLFETTLMSHFVLITVIVIIVKLS